MKKATIAVRPYRHSKKHKFIVDLRAFGKGRMFFKTRAEADAEAMRQKTLLERHGREAIGLHASLKSPLLLVRFFQNRAILRNAAECEMAQKLSARNSAQTGKWCAKPLS
jgi:hypothetical protein